ncbi:MAG: CapA family protein, partial [Thermomicrobiales bacterium]
MEPHETDPEATKRQTAGDAARVSRRQVIAAPLAGLGLYAAGGLWQDAGASQADATPAATPTALGLPDGMALVASPRLPVSGVGPDQVWPLLSGEIANWSTVGSFVPLPVRPVALAGFEQAGVAATSTAADYDDLAATLRQDAGAVALVPWDAVDFRVQALKVGEDDPLLAPEDGPAPWRLGVVGDIVPGRNVHAHMVQYGDFTRPFLRVAPMLRSFDITIANLEGNLSATLPQPTDAHSFSFVSDPAMLDGMALAGIDALTVANNHTVWNSEGWGVQAFLDTLDAMEGHGMPYFGGGRDIGVARAPLVFELAGQRIAFLGIDGVTANYEVEPGVVNGVLDFDAGATGDRAGTNPFLLSQVLDDISAATAVADIVIPYFHYGAEYVSVVPDWAAAAARSAIDAGATMVVTNHPHVNQGMEVY